MTTLEQIRAEIERLHYHPKLDFIKNDEVVEMALEIIDKYAEQEPKTGHWIKSKDGYMRCDQCGSRGSAIKARFCHHCGARMVEPQERSDKE